MKSSRLSRLPKKELKSRSTGSQTYRRSTRSISISISSFTSRCTAASPLKSHPPVKTAFYVTSSDTTHYAKLHAMLTDHSPLHVSLFTERAAAAKWLGVPVVALSV